VQQQVRNEIKQRVDDLERINQMIDNAEDAARAGQSRTAGAHLS
jgi:hypothetical protein